MGTPQDGEKCNPGEKSPQMRVKLLGKLGEKFCPFGFWYQKKIFIGVDRWSPPKNWEFGLLANHLSFFFKKILKQIWGGLNPGSIQ